MNVDLVNRLQEPEKSAYVAAARMFESDGWIHVIQPRFKELAEAAKDRVFLATNWEANRTAYGEWRVYTAAAELAEAIEEEYSNIATYQELSEGAQGEDPDAFV